MKSLKLLLPPRQTRKSVTKKEKKKEGRKKKKKEGWMSESKLRKLSITRDQENLGVIQLEVRK